MKFWKVFLRMLYNYKEVHDGFAKSLSLNYQMQILPKMLRRKKIYSLFQDFTIYWIHTSAEYFHYFQWTAVFEAINIFLPIFFWKIPFSLFSDVMVDSFWKMANLFYNPAKKSKISRLSIYWQISKSTVKLSRTEKFSKDWAI